MTVLIAALGYFVDIFDLYLFGVVRVNSLKDLGVASEDLMSVGISLLNFQMTGLIIGGVLWGVLGDKRGRASVLFGSILLYSVANLLNGFVSDIVVYKYLRFFAGLGLAGELGAAITLVSELLPRQTRGYGATIVAGVGLSGSVAAALVSEVLPWRHCYFLGGDLGLLLLFLRFKVRDSNMFSELKKNKGVSRGNLVMLFSQTDLIFKYLRLILIGMPIWFVGGLLVTFSPEFSKELGVEGTVTAGRAIYFTYIGVAIGDFVSGFLSQYYLNRKKIIFIFLLK